MRQNNYEYDAFISHAVEDKIPIANELCAKLERAGLKIWYSGKELGVGDSIEKTIERGLNRSRYGIVVFSPTYLAKNWTIREFYTLLAKEIEEQKVILPVLYNITLDELKNRDLVMADRFAVDSDRGIDFVVDRLVGEIKKSKVVKRKEAWISRIWLGLILSLLVNVALLVKDTGFSRADSPVAVNSPATGNDFGVQSGSHRSLLGEMEGLVTRIGALSCDHHANTGQSRSFQPHVAENQPDQATFMEAYQHAPQTRQPQALSPGSKVTMAVVFQFETPGNRPPGIEQDVDQILNTIDLKEKGNPFVKVSSRQKAADYRSRECTHPMGLGD